MSNSAWKQQLIDWEKADRDEAALERHLRLAGLVEADRKLIVAMKRHGQWVRQGPVARSVLRATERRTATLCALSRAAVHKAKRRLVARGVMQWRDSTYVVSWSRVWGLSPLPDPGQWREPEEGPEASLRTAAHGCARAPQEQRIYISNQSQEPRTKNQEPPMRAAYKGGTDRSGEDAGGELVSIGAAVTTLIDRGELERMHARQVEQLAGRIVDRVRPIEDLHAVTGDARLTLSAARRIAIGVCEAADGTPEELERILGSLELQDAFRSSPAAYLMGSAQRRQWV